MGWILSIFKYCKLIFIVFLISCSTNKKNNNQNRDLLDTELKNLDKKQNDFNWENTKKIPNPQFVNKTSEYGLDKVKAQYFNLVDLNNDNYSDLVVLKTYFSKPEFYFFDKKTKKFNKVDSLFEEAVSASFLLFYDFDNDGIVDVLVGVLNQKSELSKRPIRIFKGRVRNTKLSFGEYPHKVDYNSSASATVIPLDFDLDGDLDLFIGNWFSYTKDGPLPSPDILLENREGSFIDRSELLRDEHKKDEIKRNYINARPTFGASSCDIDQNGYPDILTAASSRYSNKLWLNLKDKKNKRAFRDFGPSSGVAQDFEGLNITRGGGRSFYIGCADYNNDTVMDIFSAELSHHYDAESVDKSALLTGKSLKFPPEFLRTEYILDARTTDWSQGDRRAIWFDYNNDGLLDILVDNSGFPPHSRLILFEQLPDHSFVNRAADLGIDILNPLNSVIGDFNHDGKMDILTAQTNLRSGTEQSGLYLFENQVTDTGKSLRVFLGGKKANKLGLGAMVILKTKKDGQIKFKRRWVEYSNGSLPPQNEEGIHFGLENNEKVISVLVRWPYKIDKTIYKKIYQISHLKMSKNQVLTLCEDGQFYLKNTKCW